MAKSNLVPKETSSMATRKPLLDKDQARIAKVQGIYWFNQLYIFFFQQLALKPRVYGMIMRKRSVSLGEENGE